MAEPPNLLTLPQELRDQIFSYLPHHDKRFRSVWKITEPGQPLRQSHSCLSHFCPATIYVQNSPQLSLLLTHPQLYAEYIPDLVVAIHFKNRDYSLHKNAERDTAMANALLRRTKIVTLFFTNCFPNSLDDSSKLVNAVCSAAPELKTLRFVIEHRKGHRFTEVAKENGDIDMHKVKQVSPQVLTPLPMIANLPLAQHCRAYRIRPGCSDKTPFSSHLSYRVDIISVDMFVYERKVTPKNNWTPQALLETLPVTFHEKYSTFSCLAIVPEVTEKLSNYPFGVLEWKEVEVNEPKK